MLATKQTSPGVMGAEQTDALAVNEPKMKRDVHLSVDLLKKSRPFKSKTWRTERKTSKKTC